MHSVMTNEQSEAARSVAQPPAVATKPTPPEPPASRGATIVVNGRRQFVEETKLDFARLVDLAYPYVGTAANRSYTVMFRDGPVAAPQGFVAPGETVVVEDRETFVVTVTDKS